MAIFFLSDTLNTGQCNHINKGRKRKRQDLNRSAASFKLWGHPKYRNFMKYERTLQHLSSCRYLIFFAQRIYFLIGFFFFLKIFTFVCCVIEVAHSRLLRMIRDRFFPIEKKMPTKVSVSQNGLYINTVQICFK